MDSMMPPSVHYTPQLILDGLVHFPETPLG